MNNFSKLKFFFFFIFGICLFVWVYDIFAGPDSLDLIKENYERLFYLVLAHGITLYFMSLSWFVLIGERKLSMYWSFIITWISQASGKFFPTGTITGEFIRVYLGVKKGLSTPHASSTVFADLVLATFSLFVIAIFSLFLLVSQNLDFFMGKNNFYFLLTLVTFFFSCIFLFFVVRKRLLRRFLRKSQQIFNFNLKRRTLRTLLKIDFLLFRLSFQKIKVLKALILRLMGWLSGAFEIFVFLWIIGVECNYMDLVILESFIGVIKAFVFFIPAGLGVQELAFVVIGDFVGFNGTIAFSIALGRRIREILVSFPAVIAWVVLFRQKGSFK